MSSFAQRGDAEMMLLTPWPRPRRSILGLAALLLLRGLGAQPAPVGISGLSGVTLLTADVSRLRHFYGDGAGFAEVTGDKGRVRFRIGETQCLEFDVVSDTAWPRRLQHVTLEARSLESVCQALHDRGVATGWVARDSPDRALQFEDPAGNVIQVKEPGTLPVADRTHAFSSHLQHVGMAVARAREAAAIAFYRDTLGLPESFRMSGADGRLDLVKFRLPGPGGELIELIFCDPPLNKWAAGAIDHVNFEVADIDDAYRALHLGGLTSLFRGLPKVNGERLWAIDIFDPELTRVEIQVIPPAKEPIGTASTVADALEKPLFDGTTLSGWEGDTGNWRVEGGAIVAGALDRRQPRNAFLATTRDFGNFDLHLQYKVEGSGGFVNGGVQFWSQRVSGNFEVQGYQADLGAGTDGNLYDESRRGVNLATAPAALRARVLRPGAWNDYRVRAEGPRIQIWLNGEKTVDYTEADPSVPLNGRFALQIHGGASTRVSYRMLSIEVLPESPRLR
jgi:catechol 2,3-dioxygenase-like lactoylglutathione lyase family enzyme